MNDIQKTPYQPDDYSDIPGYQRSGLGAYFFRLTSSFRIPAFRMFYLSMIGHWAPMQMQMVARTALIYNLTGSGTILGLMALSGAIPMIFISLWGGALADRLEKRSVLIWGQIGSSLISVAVAVALSSGYLDADNAGSWWILVVTSFIQGTIFGLMMPTWVTVIPELVGTERLMNAVSLNNMGMNLFRILAPAATGFIIEAWGYDSIYYAMAALYLSSTVFLKWVPKMPPHNVPERSTMTEVIEGLKYLRTESLLMLILAFTLAATILGQPFNMLLPIFTEDILHVGPSGQGTLIAASGIGAIVVSVILAALQNRNRGFIMLCLSLMLSIALIWFSFNTVWFAALALSFFVGAGQTGQIAISSTLVQYHVDPAYRGRVMSFLMLGFGLSSLGVVFGGIMAETLGAEWSISGLAMVLGAMAIGLLIFGKRLRRMD